MRPFGAWFGRLAMAGACLLGAGCGGGGDVPDPDSDSHAASAAPAARAPAPRVAAEAEPEVAPKPDPVALAANTPAPAPAEGEKPAPASIKPDEKPTEVPPSAKGDSSGTDEMLKIAGAAAPVPSAPATTPAAPTALAPGRGSDRSAPGGDNGMSVAGGSSGAPGGAPSATGGAGPPAATAPNPNATGPSPIGGSRERRGSDGGGAPGPDGPALAGAAPGMPPAPGAPGASGFGAIPGAGGVAANSAAAIANQDPSLRGTAAFARPATAVQAFLAALQAKDKDRLAQTIALHAKSEAAEKHRKIFAAIEEGSISDDELAEMAKALAGYQVASQLQAYSSGKIGILISRMDGRDRSQRTIMTRKEKEGWKVLDVDSAMEFKAIPMPRRRR